VARRRDQLTYDLGPSATRRPVPWASVAVLVVVLGLAVVLVVGLVRSGGDGGSTTAAPPPEPSAPVSTSATPSGSPSSAAPSAGTDAGQRLTAPEGSEETTTRFVRAWLDPEPTTRAPALEQVAVPALAEQLMLTHPSNIPRATPTGAPVLTDASTYSAQFTQALSTGSSITVYLVADPQARYRWLTSSVEQA
jgi:hypothetical protein